MNDCVFCKILDASIEGSFVYKGEACSAFMDIQPLSKGHVLVVPNKHVGRMKDLDPELAGEMFKTAKQVHAAMSSTTLNFEDANFFLSDGSVAGQEVPHLHIHIVPRRKSDQVKMTSGPHLETNREELNQLATEIQKSLSSSL